MTLVHSVCCESSAGICQAEAAVLCLVWSGAGLRCLSCLCLLFGGCYEALWNRTGLRVLLAEQILTHFHPSCRKIQVVMMGGLESLP